VRCKNLKENKEIAKDHIKDKKEVAKEHVKEHKELIKDVVPDNKRFIKEQLKESFKEVKDLKEGAKEVKEIGFENWPWFPRGGGGPFGGGFAQGTPGGSIEERVAALEAAVFGTVADAGAEAFIDESLRPDLMGSGSDTRAGGSDALGQGLPSSDAQAKREYDAPGAG
jgi:immune inhibitor A